MDISNLDRASYIRDELNKLHGTLNIVNNASDSYGDCVVKIEVSNRNTRFELYIPFEPVQNEIKLVLLKYKQHIKNRIMELNKEVEEL